ncbi:MULTISPECIES: helix-turn-helix transcriptional regulator [unclassified Amycolatopsis]|uniref:helix-turn-helix transcriptional regulator n=1 Tax=unclassified Amycolatopsis TaxID=2618356 RepID=UPI0028750EDC|nr:MULTISPECIES: helix-turn-helix transcriptional regulator [unclassified Amycolatopsis]MDS0135048.1 helix-turn-helix domain-containing protein [Amycolatopsis sp. 505]MDS0148876.1 helix-turn-helix domain-containing protein [Amycolatopsis sp. CM201R]
MSTELGAFLRSRRERLTPADAGLPATGRRRTPGLRREELALLAGISATWLTYLEQGRDVRPSGQVLDALARALRLTGAEQEHLHRLAGGGPKPVESEEAAPEVAGVPALLGANPAYVTGICYDVLALNAAAEELLRGIGRGGNIVRWLFTEPAAREVLVDWEQEARAVLARLRAIAGRYPDHPRVTRLVAELTEASPEVRAWWPRYEVQFSHAGHKRLRHPRLGEITVPHAAFHVAERPEQTLVVYHLVVP